MLDLLYLILVKNVIFTRILLSNARFRPKDNGTLATPIAPETELIATDIHSPIND